MSELILICVPGVTLTAEGALLRVVLTPRLSGGQESLASYGMTDWPALIAGARFDVRLRDAGGQDLPPITDVPVRPDASSTIWSAFFGRVKVTPFGGPPVYDAPKVPETGKHAGDIETRYGVASRAVGDPAVVEAQLNSLSLPEVPPPPDPRAPIPQFSPPDFHRVIALLREHPVVLRSLGLIVDLTVPRTELDRCGPSGEVSVSWPAAPPTFTTVSSPRTAFVVSGERFFAAPTAMVADGMVDVSTTSPVEVTLPGTTGTVTVETPDWTIRGFDVDGAISRLADAKQAVARDRASGAPSARDAAMPALRSAGLQLLHRRRQEWLNQRSARGRRSAGRTTFDDAPALDAEQLLLGYRVDVRRAGATTWHSLMRRTARYTVNGIEIGGGAHTEEGHLKPAAGVRGTDGVVRADEVVVRWDGWHLGVPRPRLDGSAPPTWEPHPDMPYEFRWEHSVDVRQPAIPELRFDASYQLRLRTVDIAGGGLELGDVPGDIGATPSTSYRRYEPVLPPEMPPPPGLLTIDDEGPHVDASMLGAGGALDRLVIRSDPSGAGPVTGYPANDTRLLLPPPAPFSVIEHHDRLNGSDEATWRLVRRALAAPQATSERREGRSYTWVPDPAAEGVSVTGLPLSSRALPTGAKLSSWDGNDAAWPDHEPKEVTVVPGPLGAHLAANWDLPTSAVVSVPPAMRATIEVSSYVISEFGKFAALLWTAGSDAASGAVNNGRHPMITPARRIEVVHAVRKPLKVPAGTLAVTREPGETSASIAGEGDPLIGVDRDSTAQIDVSARWNEWTDGPAPTPTREVVGSVTVDLDAPALPPIQHEFGDTKHREITYDVVARSRFREFFDATEPDSAFVQESSLGPVTVRSTARPAPPVVASVAPAFRWDLVPQFHEPSIDELSGIDPMPPIDGWTRTRAGGVVRVELEGPWFTTGEGEQLGLVVSPGPGASSLPGVPDASGDIATAGGVGSHIVTTLYRDPLFDTPAPDQPDSTTVAAGVSGPFIAVDTASRTRICVVPIDVSFAEGRRFADVAFTGVADRSYCPQVRLSLVRFQRHSLPGLEASAIVHTDIVPLLPTRALRVDHPFESPVVTLSGIGPAVGSNAVEVRLEVSPPGGQFGDLTALDPDSTTGWSVVQRVTGALNTPVGLNAIPTDGRSHRVVVREFESIAPSSAVAPSEALSSEQARRVVFAGVVGV